MSGGMSIRRALAAVALSLGLGGCAAHLPRADERTAFLERTTVSLSSDSREAFELEPALHLLLWNDLESAEVARDGGFATAASVSLLGTLRMWHDASTPVRTPTYEPRLKLQLFRDVPLGAREEGDLDRRARVLGALELAVAHRSNGEEGCALADHTRVGNRDDFDCAPTTDPPARALNVVDGSFTTHYAAAGLRARWTGPSTARASGPWRVSGGAAAEWNLPCHFGACMPRAMRDRYGAVRALWSAEVEAPLAALVPARGPASALRLRCGASGAVRLGRDGAPAANAAFEVALAARRAGRAEVGLFVRRHTGYDDLNIHFEQRRDAWIVGLAIDPSPASLAGP